MKPLTRPSCDLPLTAREENSALCQPGPHGGFLMPPTARSAGQKSAPAWQARPQAGLRPRPLDLLAHRVQTQPGQQPTADWGRLPEPVRRQEGPKGDDGPFVESPGEQQRPHGGFHTGAVFAPDLMQA